MAQDHSHSDSRSEAGNLRRGMCLAGAQDCKPSTDLAGALSRIEEGLSVYPREPRLIQIQETVQRDLQTQRRQTRRRDLEELRRIESEIDAAARMQHRSRPWRERVRVVAEKYPKRWRSPIRRQRSSASPRACWRWTGKLRRSRRKATARPSPPTLRQRAPAVFA